MRGKERPMAAIALVLLFGVCIGVLALLVLAPGYALANLEGLKAVSLQSMLRANYRMDPFGLVVRPVDMRVVEEVISDRASVTEPSNLRATSAYNALQTPVFTITPTQVGLLATAISPTSPFRIMTVTALAFTPTSGGGQPTATLVPQQTGSPTVFTPSATVTRTRITLPPIATLTQTPLYTITPTYILTLTPSKTAILPSATQTPSKTAFLPSSTPSTTSTSSPVPPTATFTVTYTATFTPTFTPRPPTATSTFTPLPPTNTPTNTPTRTFTPIPTATNTPTRTLVPYPPPNTPTRTTAPYP